MKSNKQRKSEIKLRRWQRQQAQREAAKPKLKLLPAGVLKADMERLAQLNGSCFWHRGYYEDRVYRCRDCGADCVWTARDQKWWYEQAQAHLDSVANRCRPCNAKFRAWRQSHCNAPEMTALRALWLERPDRAARERVERALASNDPAIRCLAAQALAWWWMQFEDKAAFERLEETELEKSWAPRIHRILDGELELRPGVQHVCRAANTLPANA